jgi:uncharacterized delta-60 repeat protein
MSGLTDVSEGDYQLTLAVQGAAGSTVVHWDVNWGDGSPIQTVNPAGAATLNVAHNFDGDAERRVTATATLNTAAVVQVESANHNGYLDVTFNPSGSTPGTRVDAIGLPKSVVVDADGNTIVAYQNSGAVRLKRFSPSGAPDLGWGNDALTHTAVVPFTGNADDNELSLLIQGGSLYVGGQSNNGLGNSDFAVARFGLSTGTPDGGWGAGGLRLYDINGANGNDSVNVLAAQGSSIIAAGNSAGQFAMIRLNNVGVRDTTFGPSGFVSSVVPSWQPQDAVVLADGSIVTAGPSNGGSLVVQKFNSAGASAWFNNAITNFYGVLSGTSLGLRADGKIVVAGNKSVTGGGVDIFLARLNGDGSLDTTFNAFDAIPGTFTYDGGGFDTVYDLVLQPDGTIVTLGGSEPNGTAEFAVHGFRTFGGAVFPDLTFGQDYDDVINIGQRDPGEGTGHTNTAIGAISEIRAATVTAGGSIVAAGYSDFSPNNRITLARYGRDMGVNPLDVAPTVVIEDHVFVRPNQPVMLTINEPSQADRDAMYWGSIDFDYHGEGDTDAFVYGTDENGFFGDTVPPPVYSTPGTYHVQVSVFDKDNFGTSREFDVHVSAGNFGAVVADAAHPGQTMALVGALDTTTGAGVANRITISSATGGVVSVVVDGVTTTYPSTVSRVVLYGQGGDDTIQVTGTLTKPVEIYGGAISSSAASAPTRLSATPTTTSSSVGPMWTPCGATRTPRFWRSGPRPTPT